MPNPFKELHEKVGLRPLGELPTAIHYKVLCHLAGDPDARLWIEKSNSVGGKASVSNSNGTPGWHTRGCLWRAVTDGWVTKDAVATQRAKPGLTAYRITNKGYEVIAQYSARRRYDREHLELARKILAECRKAAQDLKPK